MATAHQDLSCDFSDFVGDDGLEDEHGIRAAFETERFTYHRRQPGTGAAAADWKGESGENDGVTNSENRQILEVTVRSATTTTGGPLTSGSHDTTGILIWPATHLLCQQLVASGGLPAAPPSSEGTASTSHSEGSGEPPSVVLELGCGVGLVGVAAVLASAPSSSVALWVSTDMDERSLKLCRHNFRLNGIDAEDEDSSWSLAVADSSSPSSSPSSSCRAWVRSLRWGDADRAGSLLDELRALAGRDHFDAVVGADIVYPSTSEEVLSNLFASVEALLRPDGTFWLSFATRDGTRTPRRLIKAASRSGFAIEALGAINETTRRSLPPLLDSKILALRRDPSAEAKNRELGGDGCRAFPGLRAAIKKLENDPWSEEWEAPFADCVEQPG
jgi:ribosomal protein L11 methylase PrmA